MSIALAVLFWVLVVLVGLLLLFLLVPVSVRASGAVDGDGASGRLDARWGGVVLRVTLGTDEVGRVRLFGLPLFRIGGPGKRKDREPAANEKKAEEGKKAEGKRRKVRFGEVWARRRTLWTAAARMLRTLHLRGWIRGTVGLGDPEDTAAVYGMLSVLGRGGRRFEIDVECDWIDETLELDGAVRSIVWPIQVLWVMFVLWVRRDVRRALRAMRGTVPSEEA
jgi:hypothetical protein